MKSFFAITLVSALAVTSNGFSMNMNTGNDSNMKPTPLPKQAESSPGMTRNAFVLGTMGAILTPATAAFAKGVKADTFQGMDDPQNQQVCLDRCIYECTKKGKTKQECQDICGEKCADAKGQLTSNTPKQTKGKLNLDKK